MKIFRIRLYLQLKVFIRAIFQKKLNFKKIDKIILSQSNKNFLTYTSQLRTGFLLILEFLKLYQIFQDLLSTFSVKYLGKVF